MATTTKSIDYSVKYPKLQQPVKLYFRKFTPRRTALLLFVLTALTFIGALYYVEQQVRLRTLNYQIIELKKQKHDLIEQQKTLQLQLDQAKRLDQIESRMKLQGFVPVAEEQIRLVQ